MKPYFLELKLKDTETLDWKKGLTAYLRRSYGSGQWSQFYDEDLTAELDQLRHNANGELAPESLLNQNLLYYAYLEHLHLRLGKNSGQLKLDFTWYDAEYGVQSKAKKYSQRTLALEKSSTLYNIGVLYSQVAKEKVSDDYSKAIECISKATACFEFLSENFLNSPSVDLFSDNTKFLQKVSHAEGVELFVIKLLNGGDPLKQASLISKLAHSAARLYEDCDGFYKNGDTSTGTTAYGEVKWRYIINCKYYYYKAVASYYHAVMLEQQSKIGEAIAFLKLANSSLLQCLPNKIYLKEYIDFQGFKDQIDEKEKQEIKDNDYIYHEAIPPAVQLEVIKPMNAIKPVPWLTSIDPYLKEASNKCKMLYKGIVPMEIYEKESIYSEEKAMFIRHQMDINETANWEYSSFIEFSNLPKLIVDLEKRLRNGLKPSDDPEVEHMKENVAIWANTVQSSIFKNLDEQMKIIVDKRQNILSILSKLPPTERDNALKLKATLLEASQSDEKLFSLVRPYTEEIKLLNNGSLLWQTFNSFTKDAENQPSLLDLDDSKSENVAQQLRVLKQKAEDLRLLKEERARNLEELKDESSKDDITNVLLVNNGKSDIEIESVFESELEKFKPFSTRIEAAIFKQTASILEIKKQIDEIFQLCGIQDKSEGELKLAKSRKRFVGRLQEAISNFNLFCSDFPKGLAFYDSLLNMSRDLCSRASREVFGSREGTPPLLPPQYSHVTTQLGELSISQSAVSPPVVPPRTYGGTISQNPTGSSLTSGHNSGGPPPVPPKYARMNANDQGSRSNDFENEERELQKNPTSFYSRPSVFDENLYSKFSS
ncbi:hypothetical protein HG535_0H02610 [Zygotorulaspora mrakii]|uniref:BRO domain-containing protein 1 n=1 Tax=Zygotorulaspora mrakii TaxID=42260 RepID=A0A7H9B9G3_ZYGMR|nr:uncharacterized protein HG535_0H02610 [Zygotorulaspora mrakii]QLG74934.1 hypothetical protein HG535_0H02610 [Zygotorulaspora mrakii]